MHATHMIVLMRESILIRIEFQRAMILHGILCYPLDKTEETGIIFEPWHYRYVGIEAAKEIMEQGICLEEYLEMCFSDMSWKIPRLIQISGHSKNII